MCGIFGLIIKDKTKYNTDTISQVLNRVALLSETRGKDSSGICFRNDNLKSYSTIKATKPISELLKEEKFIELLRANVKSFVDENSKTFISFGHSRLVTNGSQLKDENNQPIIKDGIIAIHNGIIVNVDDLWRKHPQINREYEIDTEVMLSMIRHYLNNGDAPEIAVERTLTEIYGTVATALFFDDLSEAVLATNNGSLYYATNNVDFLVFASESFILNRLIRETRIEAKSGQLSVVHLQANSGITINLNDLTFRDFTIGNGLDSGKYKLPLPVTKYGLENFSIEGKNSDRSVIVDVDKFHLDSENPKKRTLLEYNIDKISQLKRCSKCLLPETFPFIHFDGKGECNYCRNYIRKNQPKPLSALKELVAPYKKTNGQPDCLVPFSGGRDSTFVLHFVKKELGLNPIAYTYDWGMVTDLGRRNIARVCGKLGVENIIVAADINMKRRNIRLNIEAWLKNPQLGMIPIFMAGDKQFFKYANQVKKQANIDLNIWGINFLENTDFKVGFCGVAPDWEKEMIYSMSAKRKAQLFGFVGKNFIQSPTYLNASLIDTFDSFLSRYTNPRKDYYHFFDFYEWNEGEIENILINEYDWETSKDLKSTWRIGDGTASFYNYIYYTVAGFSEFDTFRSNQIREGMMSRREALELVYDENKPRYESLRWYLEIVGLNYEDVIRRVNQIPKLY